VLKARPAQTTWLGSQEKNLHFLNPVALTKVVLFDLDSAWSNYNSWSWEMFEKSGIGIPDHDTEAKRCVLFGFLTAWFLGEVRFDLQCLNARHV